MKEIKDNADDERFREGAQKYARYLETPQGRLRVDLAFANLREFLPPGTATMQALDLGCGTGVMAMRLAQLGVQVTLLDSSESMLSLAKTAAQSSGMTGKITLKLGNAVDVPFLFPDGSFDLILCHNVLEYVDDPAAVLLSAAQTLRNSSSLISILVRNQAGEVLKSAIQDGDLAASACHLNSEWAQESLYAGSVRLFTPKSIESMLAACSLEMIALRGVRTLSDYLPNSGLCDSQYEQVFELERKLGARPDFAVVARYLHYLARPTNSGIRNHG